ncbi:MAG: protein kinase [Planctomycetes bacterium]|nr:protein kinase [Planctomycetota bacterium]
MAAAEDRPIEETVTIRMSKTPGGAATTLVVPRMIGNVKLGDELGRGAGGVVFAGYDTVINRKVAVKLLAGAPDGGGESELTRFVEGVRAAASVKHENIITVFNVEVVNGLPLIVMEYIDGVSLRELVKRGGAMETPLALHTICSIASGIAVLHEARVIHRDLKPANIMFDREGRTHVCDFGLACRFADSWFVSGSGGVSGTPLYMAPEMFDGSISPQSDVYALGVMLFELLAGHAPFSADSMDEMKSRHASDPPPLEQLEALGVSEELRDIVDRALHKRRIMRHKTAGHFLRALESIESAGSRDMLHRQRIAAMVSAEQSDGEDSPPAAGPPESGPPALTTFDLLAERARAKRRMHDS